MRFLNLTIAFCLISLLFSSPAHAELGRDWVEVTNTHQWSKRWGHTTVVHAGRIWVLGGWTENGLRNDVWSSSDGLNWTQATDSAPWAPRAWHTSVVHDGKIWVIAGSDNSTNTRLGAVWSSTDGIHWVETRHFNPWRGSSDLSGAASVTFDGRMWILGGGGGNEVLHSVDGIEWTRVTEEIPWEGRSSHSAVVFGAKIWIISGHSNRTADVWSSSDGRQWTRELELGPWAQDRRRNHASVVYDGKIWIIGGNAGSGGQKNDVWVSDDGVNWTRILDSAPWAARSEHSAVVFNDSVWVLGGAPTSSRSSSLNDVWMTSDGLNWSLVNEANLTPWVPRVGHTSLNFRNELWILGGHGPNAGAFLSDVWKSKDGVLWTEVTSGAPWPGRTDHSSVVFDRKMWILGGRGSGSVVHKDVWRSENGIQWSAATDDAPWEGRTFHSSVVFDNKLWVIGGWGLDGVKNDVWYSGDGVQWDQATDSAPWAQRYGHTSVVHDNRIWMLGGQSEGELFWQDVWSSNDGVQWTRVVEAAPWNGRYRHATLRMDSQIWVIGGGGQPSFENYNLQRDIWRSADGISWTEVTGPRRWNARFGHASVAFEGKLWVIGGAANSLSPFPVNFNDIWSSASDNAVTMWPAYR